MGHTASWRWRGEESQIHWHFWLNCDQGSESMPTLKPWYKIVTPREDLREGRPLDASEFAVHLDQVRDGRAPTDYQKPERFFDRTYLTQNMTGPVARGGPPPLGHPDRDLGRLQPDHPVRRRQDALPDAALPPGPQGAGRLNAGPACSASSTRPACGPCPRRRRPSSWAPSSTPSPGAAAATARPFA